ncbi:MAG: RnfABCDGE type electron transport complex subunit G [Prolixibacteraceae bacterium]|nr:RnfABCDGE type electron transport complex subunit G [Prolixibacteraceae bacterium]MBN2772988.1 RnfABCDGE type electron transport complex subunit G [Prolixibacteraceae bacterium]
MAKLESTFKNMVVVLFLVTLIAGGSLGYVNDLTKDAIEAAKLEAKMKAIKKVLPEYDEIKGEFKVATTPGDDSLEFYPAYKNGNLVGMAIKTYTKKGFSGYISVMAGIDAEGNFSGYEVLEHAETPGLGSKMGIWFNNQEKPKQCVIGKNPGNTKFQVSKDGGEIDAITASTISSRAFLDAMVRAYEGYKENKIEPATAQVN